MSYTRSYLLNFLVPAVVDLTVHLSHHVSWTTISAHQIVEFLSLIQNELPHYTPPVVR